MSLEESSGMMKRPKVIVIYGVETIGKTELTTKFPTPKFIDFEGGSKRYNVKRILPKEGDYFDVKSYLQNEKNFEGHQTIVIDSLDWVERSMVKALMDRAKVTDVQGLGGYGKWVDVLNSEWASFVNVLRELINKTQKDLVMTAHYEVKKFDDPVTAVPYDRYVMKLYPKHSALIREWVEAVLFANFQTFAKVNQSSDKKGKGVGNGVRMLYTEKRPSHDAKNRYSLPYEMPMDYNILMGYIDASSEDTIKFLQADIEELFLDVKDVEVLAKARSYYEESKDDVEKLKGIKNKLLTITQGS